MILGVSWGHLRTSSSAQEASCGRLETSWGRLGGVLGRLGGLLGASWAVLEASSGLLAAKTQPRRGEHVFGMPLGAVLGSFLAGFWMVLGMVFQHFSYLILQDVNMS